MTEASKTATQTQLGVAVLVIGAAWIGVPATGEQKAKNVLVDGSFEEGPEAGDFLLLNAGSTDVKGWTVTRAQVD
jgi:hypothetical protein